MTRDQLRWVQDGQGRVSPGNAACKSRLHLLFGVGILAARQHDTARVYLLWSGIAYVGLIVYSILFGHEDGDANFVPVNALDTWLLHLPLAAALLLSSVVSGRHVPTQRRAAAG